MNFDDALAATTTKKGPPCCVRRLLETLDKTQADKVRAAIANPDLTTAHLCRALGLMTASGRALDPGGMKRHRQGNCNCNSNA